MKSLVVAVFILIIIILGCYYGTDFTKDMSKHLNRELSEINEIIYTGNLNTVEKKFEEIDLYLYKKSKILKCISNHDDYSNLHNSYQKLKAYYKQNDFSNYSVEYVNLKALIEDITEKEKLNISNIF